MQLILNLRPSQRQDVAPTSLSVVELPVGDGLLNLALHTKKAERAGSDDIAVSSYDSRVRSESTYFQGRLAKEHKSGFRYRWGRKVAPRDWKITMSILASVMLTSTGLCGQERIVRPLDSATVNRLADVIFRCENSQHHPYGVMISTKDPRQVCKNTITHAWVDFEREQIERRSSVYLKTQSTRVVASSLPFISFLGRRYCPPSTDSVGYHNWTNNVFRILNQK